MFEAFKNFLSSENGTDGCDNSLFRFGSRRRAAEIRSSPANDFRFFRRVNRRTKSHPLFLWVAFLLSF